MRLFFLLLLRHLAQEDVKKKVLHQEQQRFWHSLTADKRRNRQRRIPPFHVMPFFQSHDLLGEDSINP